ncbi:MAG TPA: class I SAM-dependent methyltransferase [Candidatus Kapabacteria bacterium]|nr:class I SAM-dependent methyltransferase [Candidatus Kapabacteria bacterium]
MNPSNPRNPGSDIRSHLYAQYVSTFKPENAATTAAELAHYYQWCDERYYPFLRSLPKSAAILEFGCGHGRMLNYLHQKGFRNVKGIDISDEQIALADAQGLDAEIADVFTFLEAESTPLDCIIAIDFVEHFSKEELYRLFTLAHDRLTKNGLFLVQTVNGEGLFPRQIIYGDLTHSTILTPGSMQQLLQATGFSDTRFAECSPIVRGIKGMVRASFWKLIKTGANVIRMIESGKRQSVWTENFITAARR